MREIKFRAWDDCGKYMLSNSDLCEDTGEGTLIADFLSGQYCYIQVMQFTGLQDKNGVDIYEGDIVEEVRLLSDGKKYSYLLVEYKAPSFVAGKLELSNFMGITWEIIGNIHQHPELLKVGDV